MQLESLQALARRITGREVELVIGDMACTDGDRIMISNVEKRHPDLPAEMQELLALTDTAHEASHIKLWQGEGKKRRRKPLTAKEFNEIFALPLSPDKESEAYVMKLLNLVEDALVDATAAGYVGQEAMDTTNKFLVWNRQGGARKPIAEMEREGQQGKCTAFIEAVFQFSVYGELVESFCSPQVEAAARAASKTMALFAKGSVSRLQAMRAVIDAVQGYCPSPWRTPDDYKGPRDHVMNVPGNSSGADDQPPRDENSEGRGSGTGEKGTSHKLGGGANKQRFEDPRLDALLSMLERIVKERSDKSGRGVPHWRTWSPGDVLTDPLEIQRYEADAAMGIDALRSRCVLQRDAEQHLVAAFVDSSGSVGNALFRQLYIVLSALADKVAQAKRLKFGVGQFSGGAAWVMEPTDDPGAIAELANQEPVRLFHGSTVVAEIYRILGKDFVEYKSADLIVLSDGLTENGKKLAAALEEACHRTGCRIKLHIVVFKGSGRTTAGREAKQLLPQQVRVWHLGGDRLSLED